MRNLFIGLALLAGLVLMTNCRRIGLAEMGKNNTQGSPANEAKGNLLENSAEISVPGEYMQAFLVAYDQFRQDPDISAKKKTIGNYTVEFRQDDQSYVIHLIPRLSAGEGPLSGGETKLGKEVAYTIGKKDYKITARSFFR